MHELSIAFHIISEVDKIAEENQVKEVIGVTLEVGEVSGIIPQYLEDVWNWACENRSTHMKNCKLHIVVIKGISYCEDCKKTYPTTEGKVCPHCGSKNTYLVEGKDTTIKNIEVI